ncbi:hypothetical protein I3760_15G108300 [Carya illinoinensis]|nr:hypothetical protein I3760_15G108300 [Carya illinoinensis]
MAGQEEHDLLSKTKPKFDYIPACHSSKGPLIVNMHIDEPLHWLIWFLGRPK